MMGCPLKSCRYQNDGNCTDAKDYKDCILRDMIQIPQNATNGDVIRALFPIFSREWWDALYKTESEEK